MVNEFIQYVGQPITEGKKVEGLEMFRTFEWRSASHHSGVYEEIERYQKKNQQRFPEPKELRAILDLWFSRVIDARKQTSSSSLSGSAWCMLL